MLHIILPTLNLNVERWKYNKEYRVYVSNQGHFKDEDKKPIPIKITARGYVAIMTKVGPRLAHRLVMKTWCPTVDMESLTVDHLNHNKRDNSVQNLEWVTASENLLRARNDSLTGRHEIALEDNLLVACNGKIRCCGPNAPKSKGGRLFGSSTEAATWLMGAVHFDETAKFENVVKRINKAANNKGSYANHKWEVLG